MAKKSQVGSPFGGIDRALVPKLMHIAGLKVRDHKWVILKEKVNCWKLNDSSSKRANEASWYRTEMSLPIRFYNFQFALAKSGNIEDALEYAAEKLFQGGKPVHLPDLLASKAGHDNHSEKHFTYGKILKDLKNNDLKL